MFRNNTQLHHTNVAGNPAKWLAGICSLTILLLIAGCASEKAPEQHWSKDIKRAQEALDRNDRNEAERIYLAAIRESEQSGDDEELSVAIGRLSLLRYSQGNFTEVENLCARQIAIDEKRVGTNQMVLVDEYVRYAELEEKLKKYDRAEELYRQAQQVVVNVRGSSSPLAGVYLGRRAHLYLLQGKKSEAQLFYSRSLNFLDDAQFNLSFEEDLLAKRRRLVEETARIRGEFAALCEQDGHLEQAEDQLNRAIAGLESLHGKGCPQATSLFESLTRVQQALEAKAKANSQN